MEALCEAQQKYYTPTQRQRWHNSGTTRGRRKKYDPDRKGETLELPPLGPKVQGDPEYYIRFELLTCWLELLKNHKELIISIRKIWPTLVNKLQVKTICRDDAVTRSELKEERPTLGRGE